MTDIKTGAARRTYLKHDWTWEAGTCERCGETFHARHYAEPARNTTLCLSCFVAERRATSSLGVATTEQPKATPAQPALF